MRSARVEPLIGNDQQSIGQIKVLSPKQRSPKFRHCAQCALCNFHTKSKECRRCGIVEHAKLQMGGGPLIRGVATATWITNNILAISRPSTRSIQEFALDKQLHEAGVRAIFNTQEPWEHPYCGDGLASCTTELPPELGPKESTRSRVSWRKTRSGTVRAPYSYHSSAFEAAGVQVHHVGWQDLSTPPLKLVFDTVAKASAMLDLGGKIAVHCHAGFGRTGLLIACILVLRDALDADTAITKVRSRRAKCIQNRRQRDFVRAFAKACPTPTVLEPPHRQITMLPSLAQISPEGKRDTPEGERASAEKTSAEKAPITESEIGRSNSIGSQ
mmetsp:Transcript_33655/g.68796  ORF Transcript_33655/g.68796 Transcript_33655/m.68796 type:complete len:329 (-) Transcript_33655:43-1029(-)